MNNGYDNSSYQYNLANGNMMYDMNNRSMDASNNQNDYYNQNY